MHRVDQRNVQSLADGIRPMPEPKAVQVKDIRMPICRDAGYAIIILKPGDLKNSLFVRAARGPTRTSGPRFKRIVRPAGRRTKQEYGYLQPRLCRRAH